MSKKIKILRSKFKKYDIDGYIVPKNDAYFAEFAIPDRLKTISNFSGSYGFALILKNKKCMAYFLADQKSKFFKCIVSDVIEDYKSF